MSAPNDLLKEASRLLRAEWHGSGCSCQLCHEAFTLYRRIDRCIAATQTETPPPDDTIANIRRAIRDFAGHQPLDLMTAKEIQAGLFALAAIGEAGK